MTSARAVAMIYDEPQPYEALARAQDEWAAQRFADRIPDTVLFLEHQPVITLGRRGRTEHLLASPEVLRARGIGLCRAARGGDVTYHAPGQLVLYPILRLGALGADAHGYLANLEEIAIRTCRDFGVDAHRVSGKSGAWTARGKIAAIGFHLRRGITLHGMSFNVNLDMSGFDLIVPCGLVGDPVTSLAALYAENRPAPQMDTPTVPQVRSCMIRHFEDVFDRSFDGQKVVREH